MKKLTFDDWIEAEAALSKTRAEPKPDGWITAEEYQSSKDLTVASKRRRLRLLHQAGIADKKRWHQGRGRIWVYRLKPKKDWPK